MVVYNNIFDKKPQDIVNFPFFSCYFVRFVIM